MCVAIRRSSYSSGLIAGHGEKVYATADIRERGKTPASQFCQLCIRPIRYAVNTMQAQVLRPYSHQEANSGNRLQQVGVHLYPGSVHNFQRLVRSLATYALARHPGGCERRNR